MSLSLDTVIGFIAGVIVSIAVNIFSNQLNPVVTRWRKRRAANTNKPTPLRSEELETIKDEIKGLKNELEKITRFKNSIGDLYLFSLEKIAFGIICIFSALIAGLFIGIGYVLLGANPSVYGINGEGYYYINLIGFILTVLVAIIGFWRLLDVVSSIRKVNDYPRYKAGVEARITYKTQQLKDFADLSKL